MNTRLSVNINKIALLRNARGSNIPDVLQFARDCEQFGAQGITVHPRPDERHIRRSDVYALKNVVTTEFNIEGFPTDDFMQMVLDVRPHQCTLVPDDPAQLTSDHGWDTQKWQYDLTKKISDLKNAGIRVSLFIDPVTSMLDGAKSCGANRIEFYTGPYAHNFSANQSAAVAPFVEAANYCNQIGLGINAGHDLNLDNLAFFVKQVPGVLEVSIGHALVRDCLYFGVQNTIALYRRALS
ncbi:MAG: pyridoxine 5'-phosphate synthase [Chitinophagales bacterium]